MNKNELYEVAENMSEQMGVENFLDELLRSLDVDELRANLEFIDQMHDLNNFDELDE